jgi:uncharacterized Fe-S cluster protein YjdI
MRFRRIRQGCCLVGKPTLFEKRRQPRIVDADEARAARFLEMRLTLT